VGVAARPQHQASRWLSLQIPSCVKGRPCARAMAPRHVLDRQRLRGGARRQGGCGRCCACRNSMPCIWRPGCVSPKTCRSSPQYLPLPFRSALA
jgi:hypothetical protein